MSEWYVLHVNTGCEDDVRRVIQRELPEVKVKAFKRELYEKRQGSWYVVERLLFPGYIFINLEMREELYYKLDKIPGVIRVLDMKKGAGRVIPVAKEEMKFLLELMDNDKIPISKIRIFDGKVKFLTGSLAGHESMVFKYCKSKRRIKIALRFMGKIKIVELSVEES